MIRWTGLAPWEFDFPFRRSLSHNAIVTIPDSIRKLTNLTVLSMSHNRLSNLPQVRENFRYCMRWVLLYEMGLIV